MCLSTVYKDEINKDKIIMKNVMRIDVIKDKIILTDLMDRKCQINGTLSQANLVDGYAIVHVNED